MKANKQPTMKDVAIEAGVALGTVSKVFNGKPVGESYRKKVEAAAKKLNYQVNSYARGLKTNQTFSIAILIPSLRHPFFAALTDEITACLMSRGYRSNLMITNYDRSAEQKSMMLVRQNKIDGIIGLTYNPNLEVDSSIPFVTIDRHFSSDVPCVSSDNFRGGRLAAEKLVDLGCRNIVFMRIGSDIYGEVNKREIGFEMFCRENNIRHDSVILSDRGSEEPFYDYLRERIHGSNGKKTIDIDGIFCNSDQLATHIVDFLDNEGLQVPQDVQIIGYDGIKDYFTNKYCCSTIVQPVHEMAEAAVDLILRKDRAALPSLISLPVRYVSAGTTRD